ncbi:hypothetical protein MRX96_055203 [Rhipicephalus microplus]
MMLYIRNSGLRCPVQRLPFTPRPIEPRQRNKRYQRNTRISHAKPQYGRYPFQHLRDGATLQHDSPGTQEITRQFAVIKELRRLSTSCSARGTVW